MWCGLILPVASPVTHAPAVFNMPITILLVLQTVVGQTNSVGIGVGVIVILTSKVAGGEIL